MRKNIKHILCVGDSITKGFPFSMEFSWPYILGQNEGYKTINLGEPGQGTKVILRRLKGLDFGALKFGVPRQEKEEKNACTENIAIIMAGSNDFLFRLAEVPEALENILKMANHCKDKGFRPILGIPTRCVPEVARCEFMPGLDYEGANEKLDVFGQKLREMAGSEGFGLLDFQAMYRDVDEYVDGLHPTRNGYSILAERVLEVLENEERKLD